MISKREGYENKIYMGVDYRTLLDYNFEYLPFDETPGREFYLLCEDKYPGDLKLQSKEA